MKKRTGKKGEVAAVTFGSAQTIRDVGALHDRLEALLESARRVELDGAELERVDTAFLQLLAAFRRDARERGIDVEWRAAAPELRRVTALLGLEDVLEFEQQQQGK
ncbi:MAG TPA: STAS domain-containing protein [Gammaproteobacteria bacterium]|nr:STAS domain-containing protein [Gammaproteobacteria bacterium]